LLKAFATYPNGFKIDRLRTVQRRIALNAEQSQNDNAFLRAIRYLVGPEVPWPYRMLLLSTIALLIAGGRTESRALSFQLIEPRPALSGPATSISQDDQKNVQEILNYRKKQYDRLIKVADTMYDLAKIAFGALVGGLAALINTRTKYNNGAKTIDDTA